MSALPRALSRLARPSRATLIACLLVLISGTVAAGVALAGSFYADDFRGSSLAARGPWTAEWLLGWQTSRHFAPLQRAHFSALVSLAPLHQAAAVALVTVEFMTMLWLFWLVTRRLVGARLGLVALGLLGVNTVLIASFAWLVQATALMSLLIGWLLATYALLRAGCDPRRRWVLLASLGWVVAALSWESWLVGPPLLFLLCMAWQPNGGPVARVVAVARMAPTYWAAAGAVIVLYLLLWRLGGFGTDSAIPSPQLFIGTIWDSVYMTVLPSLVGGPWQWSAQEGSYSPQTAAPESLFVASAVAFAAVAALSMSRSPRLATRGLVLSVAVPTIVMVLPTLGRASQYPGLVQVEPRYLVVAMPAVVLGFAMLLAGLDIGSRRLRMAGSIALLLVIGAGTAVSLQRFVEIWGSNPSGDYVANATSSLASAGDQAGIFDSEVPPLVLSRWAFLGLNTTSELLRPLTRGSGGRFGNRGSSLMFDASGQLVPARFIPLTAAALPQCLMIRDGQARRVALGSEQLHRTDLTVRLVVRSRDEGALEYSVLAAGEHQPGETRWGAGEVPVVTRALPLQPGLNEAHLLLPPKNIASVELSPSGTDVCLETLVVGVPEPL